MSVRYAHSTVGEIIAVDYVLDENFNKLFWQQSRLFDRWTNF